MVPTASSSNTVQSGAAESERKPSRTDVVAAWAGLAIFAAAVVEFLFKPISQSGIQRFHLDMGYRSFSMRLNVMLVGGFLTVFCIAPVATIAIHSLRRRWRDWYTYVALLGTCAFLWVFIVHFGRWQFGAWDLSILVDTGWRQVLGQRPYVDFITPNPPGFNLGIWYAYKMFGVTWDANLYFSALFACVTFLWMYWLMVRLSMGRLPAMATAFAIQCAAMLTLCFWWYNNSVLILAAVFFLSCLAYAMEVRSAAVEVSYVLSLMLLSLMKPNIAGVTMIGGVFLLFVATDKRLKLLVLTLAAAAVGVGVLLVHHVSIPALLASYTKAAQSRASIAAHLSYLQMPPSERHAALVWISLLSVPMLGLVPRILRQATQRNWRGVATGLFFPLALAIAIYGLATNGEFRDVECTVLLAAGAVLTFGLQPNGPLLRRFYVSILCASILGNLYSGIDRVRIYGIGPRLFFEWQDNQSRIDSGFLKNMRVSSTMTEVERELGAVLKGNPGPYFFGPRLEYNYAVFGLPSPEHAPLIWDPGTGFLVSEEDRLIQVWQEQNFDTLIFLNDSLHGFSRESGMVDYTYYSKGFLDAIGSGYVEDKSYPYITIWHKRAIAP